MQAVTAPLGRAFFYLLLLVLLAWFGQRASSWAGALAADGPPAAPANTQAQRLADADRMAQAMLSAQEKSRPPATSSAATEPTWWDLYQKGGVLMWPITGLSLVVVCFGLERILGLRRRRVIPRRLVKGLRQLAALPSGLDPVSAAQLCGEYPSAASAVILEMLDRRNASEADQDRAVSESVAREATRLYYNVRWLNLCMSVAPMLGLMGTVQGMIIVFMGVSHLGPGVNRSEFMAQGIYLKLVCTLAGLLVAVPAAVLSHLFEARIQRLMTDVDDLARELARGLRRRGREA